MNTIDFDLVTPEWIRSMQDEKRVSNKLLAEGVNTSPSKVSQWLAGHNMAGPTKAAVYYFFNQIR